MADKPNKFESFSKSLLPHEAEYVANNLRFDDTENRAILERIRFNALNPKHAKPFDPEIDKRKYSRVKSKIENALLQIDVNEQYKQICDFDLKIMTDAISAEEEKIIIQYLNSYSPSSYHFIRFYEMLQNYRHFLLIRMRYNFHEKVSVFLNKYKVQYFRSKKINEQLHKVTTDIIEQYKESSAESKKWKKWLENIFYDQDLDGLNRYFALVRITFIGFNYRDYSGLLEKYEYASSMLKQGVYYSRPILLNYYSNLLLIHWRFKEWDKAIEYGRLSIKHTSKDYLHYAINLVSVLMRRNQLQEALMILRGAFPELKTNLNFHSRTGFVAMYVKCLNLLGQSSEAEKYASTFLTKYPKDIFSQRWHTFFSSYFQSLLYQEKYAMIIKLTKKYNILEHERTYQLKPMYLPTISWYYQIAIYKEGKSSREALIKDMKLSLSKLGPTANLDLLDELINELKEYIPNIIREISLERPSNALA